MIVGSGGLRSTAPARTTSGGRSSSGLKANALSRKLSSSCVFRPVAPGRVRVLGQAEDALQCTAVLPIGAASQPAHLAAGLGPTRVTMNCSGKHAE
ncbi:asparaginase [Streptomyces sp. NPDC005349]|uniref:asparaginase n=1 Tax=unclassified Streptomyces TaxID=2593676 RepID=UPI0033A8E97A